VSDIHKSYKMVARELQELMQLCETYSFSQTSVNVPEDAMCWIVSRTAVGFMADYEITGKIHITLSSFQQEFELSCKGIITARRLVY